MQDLPTARGPLSEILIKMLASNELPPELNYFEDIVQEALRIDTDIFYSEDLQLALFVLYELHYSGFDQVTDDWEWHPPLLALRNRIEKGSRPVCETLWGNFLNLPRTPKRSLTRSLR